MVESYRGAGEVVQADALRYDYRPFDVGFLFLPVADRSTLMRQLRARLRPGGALVVFDKCEASSGYAATALWRMTLTAKLEAGVSYEEAMQKEVSLIGVQRPIKVEELGGGVVEVFRFGDFVGWLIEAG